MSICNSLDVQWRTVMTYNSHATWPISQNKRNWTWSTLPLKASIQHLLMIWKLLVEHCHYISVDLHAHLQNYWFYITYLRTLGWSLLCLCVGGHCVLTWTVLWPSRRSSRHCRSPPWTNTLPWPGTSCAACTHWSHWTRRPFYPNSAHTSPAALQGALRSQGNMDMSWTSLIESFSLRLF